MFGLSSINPLLAHGNICSLHFIKISIIETEGIIEKISYERLAYVSVDDWSLA